MEMAVVKELLLQSLEHEMGGVKVYETALKCAVNEDLKEEWEKYHQETEHHVQVLQDVCSQMQLDPDEQTPGRKIVHDMGQSLVKAMEAALGAGDKEAAQCVAVRLRGARRDQGSCQLGADRRGVEEDDGRRRQGLKEAYAEIEDQEDEHLYHSKGWMRELALRVARPQGRAAAPRGAQGRQVRDRRGAREGRSATKMR